MLKSKLVQHLREMPAVELEAISARLKKSLKTAHPAVQEWAGILRPYVLRGEGETAMRKEVDSRITFVTDGDEVAVALAAQCRSFWIELLSVAPQTADPPSASWLILNTFLEQLNTACALRCTERR